MTIRPVYVVPQAVLRQKAAPVGEVSADIRRLAEDMLETMYARRGIGLAAPQVGVSTRLIVLDVDQTRAGGDHHDDEDMAEDDDRPVVPGQARVFINPEVTWSSEDTSVYEEGCLSIPGIFAPVTRPEKVHVRYLDLDGQTQEIEADGLLATCLQHEIDHVNGVLFIDHLSALKRDMLLRKLRKLLRENPEQFSGTHVL